MNNFKNYKLLRTTKLITHNISILLKIFKSKAEAMKITLYLYLGKNIYECDLKQTHTNI